MCVCALRVVWDGLVFGGLCVGVRVVFVACVAFVVRVTSVLYVVRVALVIWGCAFTPGPTRQPAVRGMIQGCDSGV